MQYKFVLLFLAVLLQGCSLSQHIAVYTPNKAERYDGEMTIIPLGQAVPQGYKFVGTVSYTDKGLSVNCSYEKELQKAVEVARSFGASLVYTQTIKSPDLYSTCFRATFAFYRKEEQQTSPAEIKIPKKDVEKYTL